MSHRARPCSRFPAVVLGTLAVALIPMRAEAHLVTTGLGPIYDGISHVLLSPDDLVPVLAMALLAGMRGVTAARHALFALTAAWLVGGTAGFAVGRPLLPGAATSASFLVIGVLTAADRRIPAAAVAALAGSVGLLHGWLNGAGVAQAGREALSLVGIGSAVFVLAAIAGACVVPLRSDWARTIVRVLGSWIAAIGLLMLGWWIRGGS